MSPRVRIHCDTRARAHICRYVPVAFFVIGAPVALVMGYLTDRTVRLVMGPDRQDLTGAVNTRALLRIWLHVYARRNLFVLIVIAGEIPCFCTIFTTGYGAKYEASLTHSFFSFIRSTTYPPIRSLTHSLTTVTSYWGLIVTRAFTGKYIDALNATRMARLHREISSFK